MGTLARSLFMPLKYLEMQRLRGLCLRGYEVWRMRWREDEVRVFQGQATAHAKTCDKPNLAAHILYIACPHRLSSLVG